MRRSRRRNRSRQPPSSADLQRVLHEPTDVQRPACCAGPAQHAYSRARCRARRRPPNTSADPAGRPPNTSADPEHEVRREAPTPRGRPAVARALLQLGGTLAEQPPGDDQLLDLLGALEDVQDLRVPAPLLQQRVLAVAQRATQLDALE